MSILSLAHTAQFLSLATEILSSVVSDENDVLAFLILKIVVSDKNLLYMFPAHSKFSSPATKIFVLSDENRTVCARFKGRQAVRAVIQKIYPFYRLYSSRGLFLLSEVWSSSKLSSVVDHMNVQSEFFEALKSGSFTRSNNTSVECREH